MGGGITRDGEVSELEDAILTHYEIGMSYETGSGTIYSNICDIYPPSFSTMPIAKTLRPTYASIEEASRVLKYLRDIKDEISLPDEVGIFEVFKRRIRLTD